MLNIIIHAVFWLLITIFLFFSIRRVIFFYRLPINLRWELAPLPHVKGKNKYGGSHLENYEWWKIKRQREIIAPLLYIIKEMLSFKSVWKNNRDLWAASLLLHFGIYFIFLTFILDLLNAFVMGNGTGTGYDITLTIASLGSLCSYIFGLAGSMVILCRRLLNHQLKSLSNITTYINLILLALIFFSGLLSWIFLTGNNLAMIRTDFIRSVFSLHPFNPVPVILIVHVCLLMLFLIYLPFSSMFHFVAKYFLYHKVRWDDAVLDDRLTQQIHRQAIGKLTWSAQHIRRNSVQNWLNLD